jgi:hypothetical protein
MHCLSDSQSPHLVKRSANYTDKDLKHENQDDLFVGLCFKLRELSSGLAGVHHDSSIVSSVND